MAVVKAWEQLLVLQLDLSLAVAGRAPQSLNSLSKAQPVQGMEQEESVLGELLPEPWSHIPYITRSGTQGWGMLVGQEALWGHGGLRAGGDE